MTTFSPTQERRTTTTPRGTRDRRQAGERSARGANMYALRAPKSSRVPRRKLRVPSSIDLSLEYDEAAFGDPGAAFSDRYLRIIRGAVSQRFWRLERMPERDYCDADVDDVTQDVVIRMLWFFRKRGVKDVAGSRDKTGYLCGLARQITKWQVIKFYQYRDFNREARSNKGRVRLQIVEPDNLTRQPSPKSDGDVWGAFEEKVNERFAPEQANAIIALASAEGVNEAARNIGVTHGAVIHHRSRLSEIFFGKRPSDLFGGLEPRVCEGCGARIEGGRPKSRYCSKACYKKLYMKTYNANAWAAKKAERANARR